MLHLLLLLLLLLSLWGLLVLPTVLTMWRTLTFTAAVGRRSCFHHQLLRIRSVLNLFTGTPLRPILGHRLMSIRLLLSPFHFILGHISRSSGIRRSLCRR